MLNLVLRTGEPAAVGRLSGLYDDPTGRHPADSGPGAHGGASWRQVNSRHSVNSWFYLLSNKERLRPHKYILLKHKISLLPS